MQEANGSNDILDVIIDQPELMAISSAKRMMLSTEAGKIQIPKKMVKKSHCLMWLTTLREESLA